MTRQHPTFIGIAVAVVAVALSGCKPADQPDEAKVNTEVSVQVAKVARMTLRARVDSYGTVESEPAGGGKPAGAARLASAGAGIVMEVPVKEGEAVHVGTVIAKLDDRAALAQLRLAEEHMERQNKLKAGGGTSEKAMEEAAQQLAAAQAQLALVHLVSPLEGIVSRINVQPGQAVDLNTVIAEIVDPGRLVLTTSVPTTEAASLKAGQAAEYFSGDGEKPDATGNILFVSPSVDPKTGTVLVRVSVPKDIGFRPGQFMRLRMVSEERQDRLAVPVESVVTDVEGKSVISIVQGDKAVQKPAQTGVRDGGWIEVQSEGLKEGDSVVTVGAFGLPADTKVHVFKP